MEKLRIVVSGFIGLFPTGGVTWDYIQYPLGLKLMGHDVYYIEDTFQFPKFQTDGRKWDDATDSINYLQSTMEFFGFGERWAYRDIASSKCYGLSLKQLLEICETADVFINISASACMRDEYLKIPKRVLVDTDPMFTQIEYLSQEEKNTIGDHGKMDFIIKNHNYLFSFGENIGNENCQIPTLGFKWNTTRQPICLKQWANNKNCESNNFFSTIMNWSVNPDLIYFGKLWGQKNLEFEKIMAVPRMLASSTFKVMISNLPDHTKALIQNAGWNILDPMEEIKGAEPYRKFINDSFAEFSVAKHTYVQSNSGWFSCRSACYLAAGKPVITQETGWSDFIPDGAGLISFTDEASAIEALIKVNENRNYHSRMATEIAVEYFDSFKILEDMLFKINDSSFEKTIKISENIFHAAGK